MKNFVWLAMLFSAATYANPNGYVVLAPESLKKVPSGVAVTVTAPCYHNRAVDNAQLIKGCDDTGDQITTIGILYPAG